MSNLSCDLGFLKVVMGKFSTDNTNTALNLVQYYSTILNPIFKVGALQRIKRARGISSGGTHELHMKKKVRSNKGRI